MKRLLILVLFFATAKAQQKDTINNAIITIGNTTYNGVIIIIPHQSGVAGVNSVNGRSGNVLLTKNDVGLPLVENISISAAVQNAVNNLQGLINQKQNNLIAGQNISIIGNTISASGGGGSVSAPLNLSIAPVNNFQTWTPSNYLQKYYTSNWLGHDSMQAYRFTWSYRSDVSLDNMPDNVFNLAYNHLPSGGREGALDAAIRMGWETNYKIGKRLAFELHWPEVTDLQGRMWRTNSYYIYKDSGETFQQSYVDNHTYFSVFQGGQQYINIHSNTGGTGAGVGGIGGGIDFYGDKYSNNPGSLTFWQDGFLQPATIKAREGSLLFGTLAGASYFLDNKGNAFLGTVSNSGLYINKGFDNRFVDLTKRLQVGGDVLIEGNSFQKLPSGKIWKYVINETTGAVTAVQVL